MPLFLCVSRHGFNIPAYLRDDGQLRRKSLLFFSFFGDFRGILSRAEIEFTEEEKDSGSEVVEGAEAARIGLDGLDA